MQEHKAMRIIPLGGLGGIGKNITLFEYKSDIIIVDCGIMFPFEEMPGIPSIISSLASSYIKKNRSKVKAILVTHGHEDHIGAIPYLLRNNRAHFCD